MTLALILAACLYALTGFVWACASYVTAVEEDWHPVSVFSVTLVAFVLWPVFAVLAVYGMWRGARDTP